MSTENTELSVISLHPPAPYTGPGDYELHNGRVIQMTESQTRKGRVVPVHLVRDGCVGYHWHTSGLVAVQADSSWNIKEKCGSPEENLESHGLPHAYVKNILEKVQADIISGDDGYRIFWPAENRGSYSASCLRVIADELDRQNKEWDEQLKTDPVLRGETR